MKFFFLKIYFFVKLKNRILFCFVGIITSMAFSFNLSYSQERVIIPYFGGSANIGPSGYGWGIEAGMDFKDLYIGLEYGIYYPLPVVQNSDIITDSSTPALANYSSSSAQYVGIHLGLIIHNSLSVGIVIIKSYQLWGFGDLNSGWTNITRTFWDFGPDFRYSGLADGHLYLAFALTYRRGFKAGLGYMF